MSSSDPTTTDPTTSDPTTSDGEPGMVDLHEVVAILTRTGVPAVVEQTGGGCATILAGPTRPRPEEPGGLAHAAIAGPGHYGWGRRPSVAALVELVVGPDDSGETIATEARLVGAHDAAGVARLIAEQVTHPERPATAGELTAAGFDPAPARAARERAATLGARWHPPVPAAGPEDVDTSGGLVIAEQLVTAAVEGGALRVGVHVGPTSTVDFGDGGDCVPIVLEVEGEVVFSLDEHGRARLHGTPAQRPRP